MHFSNQVVNEKLFHSCCTALEVDVISFDLSRKFDFHLKRPPVTSAIDRGVHFEISFAPALRGKDNLLFKCPDSSARKFLVSNAVNLMRATKGKNVIITSDAKKIMELRGPFDVINL